MAQSDYFQALLWVSDSHGPDTSGLEHFTRLDVDKTLIHVLELDHEGLLRAHGDAQDRLRKGIITK
jgi:hypothetical protein